MINTFVRVTDQYINSPNFSIQADHIKLFANGNLAELEVRDFKGNVLQVYRGRDLAKVIASAVEHGPMYSSGKIYFLAKR